MAAVAGAPGPGEGGESEQDSETIPGERRLGRLSCEPMEAELDSERRSLVRCEPCCGMEIDTQENAGPDIEQLGDSGAEQPRLCECRGDGLGPAGRDDRDVGEETMQVVDEHVMASKPVEMESQSCPENFLQTQSSEQSISAFSQGAAVEQECISEEHSEASHTALHPPEPELQMYVPQLEESEFQQLQMHSDVLQPPYTDILQMPGDVSQLPEPDAQQLQVHSEVPQALEPELQQLHMHGNVSQPPEPEFQQQESYVPQPPEPEVQHQEMYGGVPRPLELEVQQQEMYGDVSQPAALEAQPLKQELDQVQKIVVQQDMQQELPISLQVMQVQDTEHICVNYKPLNGPVPEETVSGGFIAQEPLSIGEVLLKEALFVEKGVSGEALSVGDTKVLSVGDIRSESIGQAGPEETISIIKTNHGEALSLREEGPGDTIPLFNKGFNDPPSMQKSSFGEILPIQTDYAEELLPIRENRPAEGSLSGALLDQRGNIATEKDTEESPDVGYTTCGVKSAAGKVLSQEELVPEIAKEQAATESLPVIETISGEVLAVQEPFTMVSLTQQKGLDVTPIKQSGLLKICALETQPQGSQKNFPSDSEHLLEEAQEEPLSKGLHLEKVEPTFQEAQNTHVPESCSLPQNCIPDDQHIKELVPECQRTQKPANVQGPVSGDILQPDKESMELYQQHSLEFIGAHHNRLLPVDVQTSSESFSETKQYIGGPVSEKNQKVQNEEPGPDSINLKVSSVETESSLDAVCGAGNMGQEMDSLSKSLGIPNHISFERDHLSPLFIVQSDGRNVSCLENKKTHELCMTVDTFLKTYPNKLGEENNTKNITCRLEIVSDNPELQSDQLSKDMAMETINGSDSENVAFAHELIPTDKPVTEDTVLNLEPIPLETAVVPGPTSIKTVYGIHTNSEFVSVSAVDYMGINQGQIAPENRKARSEQLPREPFLQRQPIPMILSEVTDSGIYTGLCLEEAKFSSNNGSEASLNYSECDNRSVGTTEGSVVTSGIDSLIPGSEVQVTLDHIIQDALVVSFCHGNRIFSGVLMDLSKRFGPHGIPVTVHPRREYKNKPVESIQEESKSFHEEPLVKSEENSPEDVTPIQQLENCKVQNLWTTKPPPLFHEGAPYPPPLFIRDTYNQSIPQPPPRKIKRPKKKIYREEPTSIMNAIKLRPRQVLCDKCKNNVVADKKEIRKVATDSYKTEEGKRRRHETVTTVNKKLKTDHKVNGKSQNESQKRTPITKVTNLAHGRGKVVKVPSQTSAAKTQMHTKKVLQNKNMDHVKAREVLKMAKEKAQKKQKVTTSSKNAHSKVHFTRRLQNSSSGTLPPRLRIKPQRYRNEENDSSLKPGLETLRSSKIGIKPQTRYSATRSAGETPSEIQSPSNGPEEISSEMQDTNVCVPPEEQDLQQTLGKRGSKSNITVYMTINQKKANSSSASVCSSDSTDDMKSSHSECSSTENFDFPPGSMHAPSSSSSSSASSKEEKKLSNSLKIKMFSKNVSKCVTPDGRTICVGDIVWAKIYGFPWWPARILAITVSRKDTGLLVRQEARISWFGSPTTSFLALSQLTPFLENFQSRFNKKRKGLYRKAITEAAKAAKQLTPEVRALLTQFET